VQDEIDLNRLPSDIRLLLALVMHYGASQTSLERHFNDYLADGGDDMESFYHKIYLLHNPEECIVADDRNNQHIADNFYTESDSSILTVEQSDFT
jgi:hypothetical protein